ncbi:MAG TPA: glycosyltransferase family 39 protein [Niabella sp.]|nr:glycosyltransferase family 39 protein [Niabella sp.]
MKNIIYSNKWLFLFWLLIAIYHFSTLSFSPLPWFDETFFASISHSVMEGKGLRLEAGSFYTGNTPILVYGPVFFYLQSGIMEIFGFSEWSFRLLNLLGAAGVIIVVNYMLLDRLERTIRISIIILLAFDTIFLQNAHSGRMDLLALLFILLSYFPILNDKTTVASLASSSLFALIAILTTPRIVIFFLPLAIWLLYILIKRRKIIPVLVFGTVLLTGYFLWINIGFGGLKEFLSYYSDAGIRKGNKDLVESFVGGNFRIQSYQFPLILLTIGTLVIRLKRWTWLTFICISNILIFYLLVKDTGIYSSLVVCFWLILFAENLNFINERAYKVKLTLLTIIGIINIGIFLIKAVIVFGSWEQRNPSNISDWVSKNIPINSRVVGDYKYYYAVVKNGSDFQFIDLGGTPQERFNYHLYVYKADFILLSTEADREVLKVYTNGIGKYESIKIDPVETPGTIYKTIRNVLEKLSIRFSEGYEGQMYKVIR